MVRRCQLSQPLPYPFKSTSSILVALSFLGTIGVELHELILSPLVHMHVDHHPYIWHLPKMKAHHHGSSSSSPVNGLACAGGWWT